MADKVFTAPKAYIEINNKKAGIIRDLSFTEDIGRAEVKGLGDLVDLEVPATSFKGRFTMGHFFIDFEQPEMKEMINRYGGVIAFTDTLALGEFSFSISIYEKLKANTDLVNKLVTSVDKYGKSIAVLADCYLDSQSWQLSNDGIAGVNSSGRYLSPMTFQKL